MTEVQGGKPSMGHYYLCFSGSDDLTTVVAKFTARYGSSPEQVLLHLGNLWLGPVATESTDRYTGFE